MAKAKMIPPGIFLGCMTKKQTQKSFLTEKSRPMLGRCKDVAKFHCGGTASNSR